MLTGSDLVEWAPTRHLPSAQPSHPLRAYPSMPGLIREVGHYRLNHHIASGGMGVVFRGWDRFRQREVAIKLFGGAAPCRLGSRPASSLAEEARIAAMLRHPNIVTLFDAGTAGAFSYLVMEYVEGGTTLKPFTRPGALLDMARVVGIIAGCARALDYMHHRGVLHLDIKPGNVLIGRQWQPKISDFGIAIAAGQGGPVAKGVIGSPGYMAPEQALGLPLSAKADIFSLGTLAYELLLGLRPPLSASDRRRGAKAFCRRLRLSARQGAGREIPAAMLEVLAGAMAWRRSERFATAGAFARALAAAASGVVETQGDRNCVPAPATAMQRVACGVVIRQWLEQGRQADRQ